MWGMWAMMYMPLTFCLADSTCPKKSQHRGSQLPFGIGTCDKPHLVWWVLCTVSPSPLLLGAEKLNFLVSHRVLGFPSVNPKPHAAVKKGAVVHIWSLALRLLVDLSTAARKPSLSSGSAQHTREDFWWADSCAKCQVRLCHHGNPNKNPTR